MEGNSFKASAHEFAQPWSAPVRRKSTRLSCGLACSQAFHASLGGCSSTPTLKPWRAAGLTQVCDQQRQGQRGKEEGQRFCRHKAGAAHCTAGGLVDQVSNRSTCWEVVDHVGCNLDEADRGTSHLHPQPGKQGLGLGRVRAAGQASCVVGGRPVAGRSWTGKVGFRCSLSGKSCMAIPALAARRWYAPGSAGRLPQSSA